MRYKAGLETREKILWATRGLIADEGLEGTTIKAVCDRAGVLPGSFYNLFDSKEQAILAVVSEAIDAVDPDPDHEGSQDTVQALVEAYVRFLEEQGDLARVYIRIAMSGSRGNSSYLRNRVLSHHDDRVQRFARAMQRQTAAITDADAERRAETLVSALNGIALHRVLDPEFDVSWHARVLLEDLAVVG